MWGARCAALTVKNRAAALALEIEVELRSVLGRMFY